LKIRTVGNGARINDGDIRRLPERDKAVSLFFQGIHQGFGFELVDFTAQRGKSNCCHGSLRLMKNAHLRRCTHPSSLRCTAKYASFLRVSCALHLCIFDQPFEITDSSKTFTIVPD
jgi:hypothetical protein